MKSHHSAIRHPQSAFLLVATRNRGKLAEITELLAGLPFTIATLDTLPQIAHVEESGSTFEENALIKARGFHEQTGLLTLADDSGLEVDVLNGAPGIHSARYGSTDAERISRLLDALRDVPDEKRTARFVCAVALVGLGIQETFVGHVRGKIRRAPAGSGGFGFDPVFEYPPWGKTFAELTREEKSSVSHRGQAFRQVREFLHKLSR